MLGWYAMPYDAKAVANFFLDRSEEEKTTLSPMKLQKLVYFAHGWYLAFKKNPLIHEPVEAWMWGPVIPSLYHEFKDFGNAPITRHATELDIDQKTNMEVRFVVPEIPSDDSEEARFSRALIVRVWDVYKNFVASQLSNMTHEPGTPWRQVFDHYARLGMSIPKHVPIPNESIRTYFFSLAKN